MLQQLVICVASAILISSHLVLSIPNNEDSKQFANGNIDQFLREVRRDIDVNVDVPDFTGRNRNPVGFNINISNIPETVQDYYNKYNRRVRRDMESSNHNHSFMADECCGKISDKRPNMANVEKCRGIIRSVIDSRPKGSADDFKKDNITMLKAFGCMAECIAKAEGVLDADGNMKKENFLKSFKALFDNGDQDWRVDIINEAFDDCVKQAKDQSRKYMDDIKCNLIPLGTNNCLYRHFELHCPNDKIIKTPMCDDMRKKWESEQEIFLVDME